MRSQSLNRIVCNVLQFRIRQPSQPYIPNVDYRAAFFNVVRRL